MDDLVLLRSRVYERNKHDAGWHAFGPVAVSYVAQHACAAPTPHTPRGRRVDRFVCSGDGDSDAFGNGYGDGNCDIVDEEEGACGGGGPGDGDGDGRGNYNCVGGSGGTGDGHGYGHGHNHGIVGEEQPWKT